MQHDIKSVTSLANPIVKHLRSLALKKYRDEEKLFIVEGLRNASDMLQEKWEPACVAFSAEVKGQDETKALLAACDAAGGLNIEVTREILGKITNRDNAQSLIAVFRQRMGGLEAMEAAQGALWLALEGIRDPGNLGTVLRTADAAGATGVLLLGETCDVFSPEVVRATAGSFARVAVCSASVDAFLSWRAGWTGKVYGTHLQGESDFRAAAYDAPLIIAMGSEHAGLSEALSKACDMLLKIPMKGQTESLNLAVSSALMLYEAMRQKL